MDETGVAHCLEKRSIKGIYLMGLALDYCGPTTRINYVRHLGPDAAVGARAW